MALSLKARATSRPRAGAGLRRSAHHVHQVLPNISGPDRHRHARHGRRHPWPRRRCRSSASASGRRSRAGAACCRARDQIAPRRGSRCSRASPSSSPCSASACWATACATSSTGNRRRAAHECPCSPGREHAHRALAGTGATHNAPSRKFRSRSAVAGRSGWWASRAAARASPRLPSWDCCADRCRSPAGASCSTARRSRMPAPPRSGAARQEDRHDLPGADDGAQSALSPVGRQIAEMFVLHQGGRGTRQWTASNRCARSRCRRPARRIRRLSAPALRRHAPARDDRHRAGCEPWLLIADEADHRARRDGAGADHGSHARAPAPPNGHGDLMITTISAWSPTCAGGCRDVCRTHRGAGAPRRSSDAARPLHAGPAAIPAAARERARRMPPSRTARNLGVVPTIAAYPAGCRFSLRCSAATSDRC